jgi:hypothetical protein
VPALLKQFGGVITTRTVQSKRSRRRLLLLVEAVKRNRFKYLYLVLQQDILTVLLEEIRHWGKATPSVFLMFLHQFAQLKFHFILASMPVTPLIMSSVTKCSVWVFDRSRLSISFPFIRAVNLAVATWHLVIARYSSFL